MIKRKVKHMQVITEGVSHVQVLSALIFPPSDANRERRLLSIQSVVLATSSSETSFEDDPLWLLPEALSWAPHYIPAQARVLQSAQFEDRREKKKLIPSPVLAVLHLMSQSTLQQPGEEALFPRLLKNGWGNWGLERLNDLLEDG